MGSFGEQKRAARMLILKMKISQKPNINVLEQSVLLQSTIAVMEYCALQ